MPDKMQKMKPRKSGDADRDRVASVAVILAITVALVLGIVFATGGGKKGGRGGMAAQESSETSSGTTTTTSTAPASVPTISPEQIEVPPLSIYRRRNPFKPLVNMVAPTTPTAPTTPGTGAAGAPTVTVPPELEPPGAPEDGVLSRAITLEGVLEQGGKQFARIRVADQLFEKVGVGDTFGESYKLLALGKDSSATILFGDERFTIFAGQSIYW